MPSQVTEQQLMSSEEAFHDCFRIPLRGVSLRYPHISEGQREEHRTYIIPVPYISFIDSASCMKTVDLRSTWVAILRVLKATNPDLSVHIEAWKGYKQALIRYGLCIAQEYQKRGLGKTLFKSLHQYALNKVWGKPNWVYCERTRLSFQKYLKYRDYRRYILKLVKQFIKLKKSQNKRWNTITVQNILERNGCYANFISAQEAERIYHYIIQELKNQSILEYVAYYQWDGRVTDYNGIFYPERN